MCSMRSLLNPYYACGPGPGYHWRAKAQVQSQKHAMPVLCGQRRSRINRTLIAHATRQQEEEEEE